MLKLFKKGSANASVNTTTLEVTCPKCKVTYKTEMLNDKSVRCMDCGCVYHQKTHSNRVISWVREKIITVGGC